jgi:hypothetical protein
VYIYIRPKVVGPILRPCASGSYVHWAALFLGDLFVISQLVFFYNMLSYVLPGSFYFLCLNYKKNLTEEGKAALADIIIKKSRNQRPRSRKASYPGLPSLTGCHDQHQLPTLQRPLDWRVANRSLRSESG